MTKVVVLGDFNVDIVAVQSTSLALGSDTAARVSLMPGGGGANVASWLAKAGVEVTLIGRVGEDALAPVALSGLDGVDLQVVRDPLHATGTTGTSSERARSASSPPLVTTTRRAPMTPAAS